MRRGEGRPTYERPIEYENRERIDRGGRA